MKLILARKVILAVFSAAVLCLVLTPDAARASEITLRGLFTSDDNIQFFHVTVATAGPVDIRSYGYAGGTTSSGTAVPGGGFDTILTVFDGSGQFLGDNDDGTGVATDLLTGLAGDARMTLSLTPGSYLVALTQFDNFSIGDLADGFSETGNSNFTADPSFTGGGACPGNLFRDTSGTAGRCRDGNWAVDFVNVANVAPAAAVPEPGTLALLSAGLLGMAFMLRKKSRSGDGGVTDRVVEMLPRILRGVSTVVLFAAALPAQAQGPDYSNVNDFLNGRRTLLSVDDLVVSGIDSAGQIHTSTSTTTNSQFNPASTSSVCCQAGAVSKILTGHMFNLPSSTTVELVFENGPASQIRLPFIGQGGTGILTAFGLIGGAMADFNGDGYDDLVLYFTGGRIQVVTASDVNHPEQSPYLNFGPISSLDTLSDITAGDFNGDGRPEIAGLAHESSNVLLVIYTVDPKTLAVAKASQITQNENEISEKNLSITRGRFTPAAHDQIIVAYSEVGVTHLELVDFSPPSLTPQKKTFTAFWGELGPWGDGVMKIKTGKFGLPANPYDQVVFMFAIDGHPNYVHEAKYLSVLNIDPATLAWTQNPIWDMGDLNCVFDVSVGNFDNRQPDPLNPGQTQHNFNNQIAVIYSRDGDPPTAAGGTCNSGPRNLAILDADSGTFSMSLASAKELPSSLNGLIPLSFTASDTQGRSMILGEPTKITLSGTVQPSVVIGVPPMHVDFISPDPLNNVQPMVMNLSAVPDGYKATYDQEDSTSNKSGSTNTTSWSFGSKESAGASLTIGNPAGTGFKASDTLKAAQNLKGAVEHDHGTFQRKAFSLSATTGFGDEVSYLDPEFNIWVYPVIGKTVCPTANPNCSDSEKVPLTIQFSAPNGDALTHATQGQALQWYQPPWEPGNIFSYPANLQQLQRIYPNLTVLTQEGVEFLTDAGTLTQKTSWSVTTKDSATTSLNQNYSFENDFSYTEGIGVEDIANLAGTFKLDLSGSTGFSSLNKQTTDLGASTGVRVSKPGTFPTFQNYGYQVAPYLMGTKEAGGYVDSQPLSTDVQTFGLLRAMFTADPLAKDAGGWWRQAYSQAKLPDVALNHPSRWQISTPALANPIPANCLATGTGASQMDCAELSPSLPTNPWLSLFHQMRGFFISSAASPGRGPQLGQAAAGDVLTLQARVYNYSLSAMPSGSQVHVRFYFMPWAVNNNVPAGPSVLIGEDELSPIPEFSETSDTPNWVLASTTFDTSKYQQTKDGAASIVFWVVVWVQKPDGTLMQEMPSHGLTGIPGTLKSIADAAEEPYSNNVGLYKQAFYIAPPVRFVGAPPTAGPAFINVSKVEVSADRISPRNTIVISARLAAVDGDASGVSANFYDGDPEKGGRLFDVERVPHIAQAEPHMVQASYRTNTCGVHELFVSVNRGKSSEVMRRSHPVRVDCNSSK